MSVDNQLRKAVYNADGETRNWGITFDYADKSDVGLYTVIDSIQQKVENNFEIVNNEIIYPTQESGLAPLQEGVIVLVIRETPLTQEESSEQTPFTSSDVERALDKLTYEVQEVREEVNRALKTPDWSDESAADELLRLENKIDTETSQRMSADAMLLSETNSKQDKLISGTNIKTVNNQSLLGSGNIDIDADGYLPKVFDGEQTITAKQNGNNITLNLNYKEDGGVESKTQIQEQYNKFLLTHSSKPEGGSFSQDGYFEITPTRTAIVGKGGQYVYLDNTGQVDINPTNSKKVRVNGYNVLTAAERGANNGVASLGSDGKVPSAQLPTIDTLPSQTGHSGQFLTTDGTDASWKDIPTFTQEQADWNEADNAKASFIKNKPTIPDVSGKANLAGGNSFTGTQSITNASNTAGIQLFETTNNSHSDITQTSLGLDIVCNSTNAGFKFNDVSLLKNVINISSFPAVLVENKNYYATVSGSASFTLPTPTNTSFENTINILLTVSVNSTVDWGVNVNSVLSSFAAGKYEIRLRYNNSTSNWIGEVLKSEDVPNPVKLYVPFYKNVGGVITGAAEDLSNNPVSLSAISPDTTFPTYGDGKFTGTKAILTKQYKGFTVSGDKTKLNLGSGDFTLSFWIKSTASNYNYYDYILYSSSSTYITPKEMYYNGNDILSGTNVPYDGEFHYVCYARHNNSLYHFVDGKRTKKVTYSGNIDFSDIARIATITSSWGTNSDAYVQELLLTNTCDYDDDTTTISVPTAPYVLADNSIADYHDSAKQDSLNTSQMNAVNSGIDSTKVAQIATNTYDIGLLQTALQNLSFVEFVNSLPASGTSGKIYCVPLNETDLSGRTIVEEFIYNNSQWYAVGAFSTNIDASTLVLKSMFEFDSGTGTLNINLGN